MSKGLGARLSALVLAGVAALAVASSASAAMVRTSPMIPTGTSPLAPLSFTGNDTVTSTNWSGYAVQAATKFTDVKGTWVQPAATCSGYGAQYASFWAGIDGYSSSSVEQLGTDSDCAGHSRPSYYAWWEMYPANSVSLSKTTYPVNPGDTLTAEVKVTGTTYTLSLTSSEGWTFATTKVKSGLAQSSAELIAESPSICGAFGCHLAKLADFGTVNFTNVMAAVNGGAEEPFSSFTGSSGPHEIIGESSSGTVRAQPSGLMSGGTAFSIAWKHT